MIERLIPYSAEVYLAMLADYNAAIDPNQWFAVAFALVILLAAKRGGSINGRWALIIIAGFWTWTAYKFHYQAFSGINYLAPIYAGVFALQAALLMAWAFRGTFDIALGFQLRPLMGINLMFVAAALHPIITIAAGLPVATLQSVGVAPMPTVLATLAAFAFFAPRPPFWLIILPLLWSVWEILVASTLGLAQDLALPVIALLAGMIIVRGSPPQALPADDG